MLQVHPVDDLEQALTHSIAQAFSQYDASSQSFFKYLETLSIRGLNRHQYEIYRDNFFFRTSSTPRSISRLVTAAFLHLDLATLETGIANLQDELGHGNPKNSHLQLLESAYNYHGEKVFALSAVSIDRIGFSKLICPEAIEFRAKQKSLYQHRAYTIVLGCSFAQEFAADQMLRIFYKTLFQPYRSLYTEQEFKQVSRYFTVHINGLEAHHAAQARSALLNNCRTSEDLALMQRGMTEFLGIQANLWNGILREMRKAGD